MIKTTQVYVRDCTPVSAYALMLFGGALLTDGKARGAAVAQVTLTLTPTLSLILALALTLAQTPTLTRTRTRTLILLTLTSTLTLALALTVTLTLTLQKTPRGGDDAVLTVDGWIKFRVRFRHIS